jgi:hypothetical protein
MPDTKISALTNSTTPPAATDAFVTVENMGSVPATKRKAWSILAATVSSQIILFGASATLDTTTGATAGSKIEMATNKQNLNNYPSFPNGSKTYVEWDFVLPGDWVASGTFTAEFFWTANSASTNSVVWGIQGRAYASGDAIDQAWGSAVEVTSANTAAYGDIKSSATAAVTLAGTVAGGNSVRIRAYRLGSGADNLAVAALLKCVRLNYSRA